MRNAKSDYDHNGGHELDILGGHIEVEHKRYHDTVENGTDHDAGQGQEEVFDTGEDGFSDDDGGKSDDDGSHAHGDIGIALILAEESARQGDHAIGESQADDLSQVGINSLRPTHFFIDARGTDARSQLGSEEPVQQEHDKEADNASQNERKVGLIQLEQTCQRRIQRFDAVQLKVGGSHDMQIDREQRSHSQNSRKNGGYLQLGMKDSCHDSRQTAGAEGDQQTQNRIQADGQELCSNSTSQGEASFTGHVSKIKNTEGQVHAKRQQRPDQALRDTF